MKVLIAGDFVPNCRTISPINSGDFRCIDQLKPIIQSADYSIVNYESPVLLGDSNRILKTGPSLSCSERAMECVAQAGFNCITLANNHFRDYGQEGVQDTLEISCKYNIDHVGGGKNLDEASNVLYKLIDGKILAVINFCENEWSIATHNYGGSAPMDPVKNFNTIREARQKSDYVLVIIHGGIEGYQYPTQRMVDTYRFFIDAGADAVVNHHQHCFSGYEIYNSKPIFYGLGNFCFDKNNPNDFLWTRGYLVIINFNKLGVNYEIIPYVQCAEHPIVNLLHEQDKRLFFDELMYINEVISNVKLLKDKKGII